ncbi:hypothetical protein H1R20_g11804, partial [Candolleomyces eurysporus]
MPQETASKKSKGKRPASASPERIELPPTLRVAPKITLRRSRAVRTIVAYPSLGDLAKGLGPYLNPSLEFDLDRSLFNRLTSLILDAQPRLQAALLHVDTCRNEDLLDLALHISFLFWRLCPHEFQQYHGTEGWYWLKDQVPTTPFAGLQSTGEPVQAGAPTFPDVILPNASDDESEPAGEEEARAEGENPAVPATGAAPKVDVALIERDIVAPEETVAPTGDEDVPMPAATPPARPTAATNRPTTVISLPHLQPPPGRRPRVAPERKKAQKHEAFPHVEPPGVLPVYEMGPLFLQSSTLRELTLPLNAGPVPSWVRPPCGQCASHGLICTGGDFLNHIRCDQCASLKQTCGFDTRIPRFASLQQLAFAGEASPANISQLVSDVLNLRAMAQIAASHAEDLQKMTKAKLETLSLVLQRVYSSEGDAGLSGYARNVGDLEEVLKFAKDIPLDTPMRFPERLHATMQQAGETEYRWLTNYQRSIYHNPPRVMSEPSEDLENTSFYADEDAMEVEPSQQAQPAPVPAPVPAAGPSTFPGSLEAQAAPNDPAASSTPSASNPTGDTTSTAPVPAQIPQNIQNQADSLYTLLAPHFHPLLREAAERRRRGEGA